MKRSLSIFFMTFITFCAFLCLCSCRHGATSPEKKLNGQFEAEIIITRGDLNIHAEIYVSEYIKGKSRDVRIRLLSPSEMTLETKDGKVFMTEDGFSVECRKAPPILSMLEEMISVDSVSSLPKENGKFTFLADGNTRIYCEKDRVPFLMICGDTSVEILSFRQDA